MRKESFAPLNSNKILEVITKWNFWDKQPIPSGFEREKVTEIKKYLKGPEVIVLKGIRRSGKSTLMMQLINYLKDTGVPINNIFYLNLEEPLFIENRNAQILEQIYQVYRENLNPDGYAYIFLDEVQEIPGWEKWVRTKVDLKEVKFFVTGSSSKLLNTEYSTLLTGRNISFSVYPLEYKEFLKFKGIEVPDNNAQLAHRKTTLRNLLKEYQRFGGFPEVVLKKTAAEKEKLLKQYFEDIIYRDVVARYQLRDIQMLKNIALFYLSNIAGLSTYNKLKNSLGVPLDVVRNYTSYLIETYLISEVPMYSFKLKEQLKNPRKIYSVDTGLRNAVSYAFSGDVGKISENIVFNTLSAQGKETFYFKGKQEIDFLLRTGLKVSDLIQVSMLTGNNQAALVREIEALKEGLAEFKLRKAILVTDDLEQTMKMGNKEIKAIPLWKWLTMESTL